jgi:hypothetical protein
MSSLHRALFHTATKPCPACGEPTFRHAFTGATDEVCALLGVQPDAEVCTGCRDRAEQELDAIEAELALDSDPDFVTVCDARRDAWIDALESDTAAQWAAVVRCGGDALDAAVSL